MKAPYVLAVILLLLILLGQVRVGGQMEYSGKGLFAWVRIGAFHLQVFPWVWEKKPKKRSEKQEKKPKSDQKKQEKPQESPSISERVGGALDYAQSLLPIALEAAGQLKEKIQIDTLDLELTVGSEDPADAAMRYGQASAVLGAIWYPLTETFRVKDGTAHASIDFHAKEMTLYGKLSLSLKIGQILWLGLYFGMKALRAALAVRKERSNQKKRKAA